tara:strand:+ start:136 stop:600 length:465 start_codon:yes stop_codon:yes gene_type:complete
MFPHNNEGRDSLLETYDLETITSIADNGCESGVCSQHIYYADTIGFFEKYEAEVLDLIHVRYGTDELVEIFKRSEADYDMYRNECTWLFIENVAQDHVMELEQMQEDQDAVIADYMKQEISNNGYTLDDLKQYDVGDGYNSPYTMTDSRYAQAG